jgi:hypothetical protein
VHGNEEDVLYVTTEDMKRKEWYEPESEYTSNTGTTIIRDGSGNIADQYDTSTYDYCVLDTLKSGYGYNIRHFHKMKRKGALLPHTPWRSFTSEAVADGKYDVKRTYEINGSSSHTTRSLWCNAAFHALTPEDLEAHIPANFEKMVTNAAAKIYTSGFDLLTFIAEFREIPKMFIGISKKLLKAKLPKKKGEFAYPIHEVASDWLTWRYGVRPLISDLIELNELIKSYTRMQERTRFSEKAYSTHHVAEAYAEHHPSSLWTNTYHYYDDFIISERGSVTADITLPTLQFNPILTAWELVPLSFVYDWFVNIGKTLAAVHFLAANEQYSASAGFLITAERSVEYECTDPHDEITNLSSETASCSAELEVRVPCQVPSQPRIALNLDVLKVLDLTALVTQRINRRK